MPSWKPALAAFFDGRARSIKGPPSKEDLCFIAGRDPRLWRDQALFADMIDSIVAQAEIADAASVLEVGCAAGFIASGLAPRVRRYAGVDLAPAVLKVARQLGLPNADFKHAEGNRLPFRDNSFDAALCYDVYTNFPTFADGAGLIREMLRVVVPGGRVLVGSIPDEATAELMAQRAQAVANTLAETYGPLPARPEGDPVPRRSNDHRFGRQPVEPQIVCYYFNRQDFEALGSELCAEVAIHDIHRRNPYFGCRFNVVYRKNTA